MDRARVVFTIVSKNYLHFARTLMESVRTVHPEWERFVLLVDENRGELDLTNEPFQTVEIAELPLPERKRFYFRYTIMELNTAVKPWMFEWLFRYRRAEQVVYLDPDIYVYRPLAEVNSALSNGATMALTPHLTGALDDAHRPHEVDILLAGAYNLGFLALRCDSQTASFLSWWQSKLEHKCIVDHARGLFVDQKWLDLAPGMFDGVAILRHEGYNVAYWNLAHRRVERVDGAYTVNGDPLVFFHFSGLDAKTPERLSKYQNRFRLEQLPAVQELVTDYLSRLRENGIQSTSHLDYAFGRFATGEPVPDCIRQLYRQDEAFQGIAGNDPFVLATNYLNRPVPESAQVRSPVTVLMRHIWLNRPDLQHTFPRVPGDDSSRFARWFVGNAAVELGIPEVCITPVANCLLADEEAVSEVREKRASARWPKGVRSLKALLALDDAEFVVEAYRKVLGRPADQDGFRYCLHALQAGGSRADVLWGLRHSQEGRLVRTRLHGLGLLYLGSRLRRLTQGVNRPQVTRSLSDAEQGGKNSPAGKFCGPPENQTGITDTSSWAKTAHDRFGRSEYIGFYDWADQHEGLVWLGRTASVRLPRSSPRNVQLVGSYDAGHQRKANGSTETVFDVQLNGRPVSQFALSVSGEFEVNIRLPDIRLEQPAFLTLNASQVFIPAALGLNADPRELSVRIARIVTDGRPLLDFSRASPYAAESTKELGLNIIGYLRSEHGIGESARLCARSVSAVGLEFALCDFNAGSSTRTDDARWEGRLGRDNPYPVNLFHVNADQMTLARETFKEAFFRGHYNIGYWHWELPDFPDRFRSGFAFLNEVWVPSTFVLEAVGTQSPVPVVRIPHSICINVDSTVQRAKFGLPADRFLFLTMYDMHSAQGRKNPQAVVAAFKRAFRGRSDVGLVIKVHNTSSYPDEFRQLREEIGGSPNFILIDRTLSRNEVYELEMLCDSFVSLHRSEGFGLGLAECMYLGKPVIGTNWSGNVDFMNSRNSCPVDYEITILDRDFGPYYRKGNRWADPSIDHAAWYMSKLVDDVVWRTAIATKGRETIHNEFSPTKVGSLIVARLSRLEWP